MLGELDLTYVIRNEVLAVTTPEAAERELETRLYPVADLAVAGHAPVVTTHPRSRFQTICDLICRHVEPASWDSVGGAATITPLDARGLLAISQTDAAHHSIEALLAAVRQAAAGNASSPQNGSSKITLSASAATAKIDAALGRPVDLEFNDAPLLEVVDYLKQTCHIPIMVDRRAR